MKERMILMSPPMARATHLGTKTITRRPLYVLSKRLSDNLCFDRRYAMPPTGPGYTAPGECWTLSQWSRAKPGDILVVREAFSYQRGKGIFQADSPVWYWADGNPPAGDWERPKPSIHMPRWAARSVRDLLAVRVERLQDITEADAIAEGVAPDRGSRPDDDFDGFLRVGRVRGGSFPIARYAALWEWLNGPGSWSANPWVVVLTFKGP